MRLLAVGFLLCSGCVFAYLLVAAVVARGFLGLVRQLVGRGETSGVPEEPARSVTVPASDGSHEALPEDRATETAFWNLAKTIGIEADR